MVPEQQEQKPQRRLRKRVGKLYLRLNRGNDPYLIIFLDNETERCQMYSHLLMLTDEELNEDKDFENTEQIYNFLTENTCKVNRQDEKLSLYSRFRKGEKQVEIKREFKLEKYEDDIQDLEIDIWRKQKHLKLSSSPQREFQVKKKKLILQELLIHQIVQEKWLRS